MVDKPFDDALWPRTRKGVALYALAAIAAIILGIIPALWINRWRASEAAADPPHVMPIVAEPAPVAVPPPAEIPVAAPEPETEAAIEMVDEAAPPAQTERAVSMKTTKRARPRPQRAKPATKKAAPTCDIYLYPHGCPK